jgi:rSAM/selenodomain-associated transferase 1
MLEAAVRLRVHLFDVPYGDQAIFVRRTTFNALGGYADLPLMEDVELVRRLRCLGPLLHVPASVTTSARRWERDGWMRRSATNVWLLTRFLLGASPARLAQRYAGRRRTAAVMMGRAPWCGGKTRLHAGDDESHAALREALFFDTLDAVRAVPQADHLVACTPADETPRLRTVVGPGVDVFAQRGRSLGEAMVHVVEDVFRLGYESVVIVGSDLPDLPASHIASACLRLAEPGDRVVLGPATDGGYYLIGLKAPHPELFDGIDWSTSRVLAQTTAAAARAAVPVVQLAPWDDVDEAADLQRLSARPGASAPRTRAWVGQHADLLTAGRP